MPEESGGRRPRRSRGELRDLLIDAGRGILAEEGLTVGTGELTFSHVFRHVEATSGVHVTNASVIRRIWENQEEYQADVLEVVASTADASGEMDRTVAALTPLLGSIDHSTPEARLWSLRELARVGGEASIRARLETRDWSLWIGVWVLAVTMPPDSRQAGLRDALRSGLDDVTAIWEELFQGVCDLLGIRVRAPLTLRQFTVAVSASAEGSALRQGGDPVLELMERPTGRDGEMQTWTLFGVCLESLAVEFFEIDPDWPGPEPTP